MCYGASMNPKSAWPTSAMASRPTVPSAVSTPQPSPSARQGMGSIPFKGGAAFRVWAPFADSVAVAGTFNAWSTTANPLAREPNNCWSADVLRPEVSDQYKFVIRHDADLLWRTNPYAHEVTNPGGNSTLHDRRFDWGDENFATSPWNELVIYEM